MRHIDELKDVSNVNLVVFDVDGVIIPFGTKVVEKGNAIIYDMVYPSDKFINLAKELLDYTNVAISSGRNMLVLKSMFSDLLGQERNGNKFMIQAESGGRISCGVQEIGAINDPGLIRQLSEIKRKLRKVEHPAISGFEPKESVITMYCSERIEEIENLLNDYPHKIFWTGETYEVTQKGVDKGRGVEKMKEIIRAGSSADFLTVAIGDRENDLPLLEKADITISADKECVKDAQYFIDNGGELPGVILAEKLLNLFRGSKNETY